MRSSKLVLATILFTSTALFACGSDSSGPPDIDDPSADIDSCVECHSNQEALFELHTPDSVIPTGGCSGPPPYYEPYERVYLDPQGFASFESSTHGQQDCTTCHGGVDGTADKATAHSGTFVRYPSFENLDSCAQCHEDLVTNFQNGLHFNGWGQRRSQMLRAGVESWDELHEGIQEGYDQNCATCHASCGSCHVNRPIAGGGGLMNGHAFDPPDMRDNCTACHSSRGGHAYYGEGIGTKPDVHLTQAGYTCLDCHSVNEMHASTGQVYEYRYQVEALPQCVNCHADLDRANSYHTMHYDDFNCQTCHSQDYNTCGSCHVAGEGARIHSYLQFKIGLNPLPNEKPYKLSTVRRTLAAPDSWEQFGVEFLPNFDAKPIYNYTSPHNIQRWTARTTVEDGQTCSSSCHIRQDGDTWLNRSYYLFSSDFSQAWERSATSTVVVDGQLPAGWGTH